MCAPCPARNAVLRPLRRGWAENLSLHERVEIFCPSSLATLKASALLPLDPTLPT